MRNDDLTTRLDVQPKRLQSVNFERVSAEQWVRVFGTKSETAQKRGTYVMHNGQLVLAETVPTTTAAEGVPVVHDDRLYRGYNTALRCYVRGRTHEREILKERGFRHAY